MKIKFKRPCFVSGVYYEPFVVHEIPAEAFPKKVMSDGTEKDGWPVDAVILPDDAPVENRSTTPKTAPGTKDDMGHLIGRQDFVSKGAEPQQNKEIPDELGDDLAALKPAKPVGKPPIKVPTKTEL